MSWLYIRGSHLVLLMPIYVQCTTYMCMYLYYICMGRISFELSLGHRFHSGFFLNWIGWWVNMKNSRFIVFELNRPNKEGSGGHTCSRIFRKWTPDYQLCWNSTNQWSMNNYVFEIFEPICVFGTDRGEKSSQKANLICTQDSSRTEFRA